MPKTTNYLLLFFLFTLSSFFLSCTNSANNLKIQNATCGYRVNPELVSKESLHFGWQIHSEKNDIVQTAYALELYSNEKGEEAKIWDSGKIESNKSQNVRLQENILLQSGEKYSWRVRVWDNKNDSSKWSAINTFRIAPTLIDSKAQWIGAINRINSNIPEGRNYHNLEISSERGKIWRETDPLSKRSIFLRKELRIDKKIKDAVIYISGLGHYELSLNGEKVGDSHFEPMWSDYDKTVYYNAYDVNEE